MIDAGTPVVKHQCSTLLSISALLQPDRFGSSEEHTVRPQIASLLIINRELMTRTEIPVLRQPVLHRVSSPENLSKFAPGSPSSTGLWPANRASSAMGSRGRGEWISPYKLLNCKLFALNPSARTTIKNATGDCAKFA